MSNSADPDETAHYELSHLDLRCLQKSIITACGSERVKIWRLLCHFYPYISFLCFAVMVFPGYLYLYFCRSAFRIILYCIHVDIAFTLNFLTIMSEQRV